MRGRGQVNLPALAIALLVVTTVAGLSLAVADSALVTADRDAAERATATAVADRLVAADSPLTDRRNVLNASRLDRSNVKAVVPPAAAVRVELDDETLYEHGDPTDGTTARRLALVAEPQTVTVEPPLAVAEVTLPRRSPRATLWIDPDAGTETVRANGRVVLHDPGGLEGIHEVTLSRYETTTLRFDGDPSEGDVSVTHYPRRTTKARLEVTVDA